MGLQLDVLTQILERVGRVDGAAALRDHIRTLPDAARARDSSRPISPEPSRSDSVELEALVHDGYAIAERVAEPELAHLLRDTVRALVDSGAPGVFAFMLDEMWTLAEDVRQRLESITGDRYELLDDGWAWSIAPGRGRGWAAHRGGGPHLFDRRAPELVTAWVALGDVTAEQSCMHVVPLDDDPNYPEHLERVDAPLEVVRALPIRSGDTLFWNANLLHWGGTCSARARRPRVSCSFSFGRAGRRPPLDVPAFEVVSPSPERRRDMIARQIVTYGQGQADVTPEVLQWANAHRQLGALVGRP